MLESFFTYVAPEIFLLSFSCLILLVDLFIPKEKKGWTFLLTEFAIVMTLFMSLDLLGKPITYLFSNHFVLDSFSQVLKAFMLFIVGVVLLYSRDYVHERQFEEGEYYVLTMLSSLGMMVMVSANSALSMYLGLELLSLPLYTLVAMRRDGENSNEAAIKYFILGALASGMLLYGISLIYGATGSLEFPQIAQSINENQLMAVLGAVFVVVGVAFKLGAAPFHMWVPDVYEGAPTSVTLLIASAPKIAAFGMLYRFFGQSLAPIIAQWSQWLAIMAVVSIAIGNFAAILQTNLKRLLAYSTISHIGFILLAFLCGQNGYAAAMHYVIIYALMSMGAFAILVLLSRSQVEIETFDDLKGLSKKQPWLAFMMLLIMFSMTGVPPTIGFYAKLMVMNSLIDAGHLWLAVIAMVFSIVGAFYYLKVVKVMYFDEPISSTTIVLPNDVKVAITLNGMSQLLLGLMPGFIATLCMTALGL